MRAVVVFGGLGLGVGNSLVKRLPAMALTEEVLLVLLTVTSGLRSSFLGATIGRGDAEGGGEDGVEESRRWLCRVTRNLGDSMATAWVSCD